MRTLLVVALALSVTSVALGAQVDGQALNLAPRGDVLVVVADDVNWYDVDNVPTPTLDRLMGAGTTWRRFYTAPTCSPTRYALQFGRWPRRDGILNVLESANSQAGPRPHPDESLASLGDLFQGRGYRTGFFGKWHTGLQFYGQGGTANPSVTPLFLGYDAWRAGTTGNIPTSLLHSTYFLWDRLDDGTHSPGIESYVDEDLVAAVNQWWQETEAGPRPRYGFVGMHLAHGPMHEPPAYLLPPGHPAPTTTRERFECMLMALDELLDRMIRFDAADPDGEVDLAETLVVFLGDNGTPGPAAGPQAPGKVKGSTFEGGIRCPLVIAGPDFTPGRVEEQRIVAAVDLFATLAAWLGGRRPVGVAEDSIPVQTGRRRWTLAEHVGADDELAIVWDDWKLRRFNGVEELYDLVADPGEEDPLDPLDPRYAGVTAVIRSIEAGLPARP